MLSGTATPASSRMAAAQITESVVRNPDAMTLLTKLQEKSGAVEPLHHDVFKGDAFGVGHGQRSAGVHELGQGIALCNGHNLNALLIRRRVEADREIDRRGVGELLHLGHQPHRGDGDLAVGAAPGRARAG